jgi:hypothetical protein
MMSGSPSVVVIDANIVGYLLDPKRDTFIARNCQVANLRIWPSSLNALEVLKHPNPQARARLLGGLARWLGNFPLLPLPHLILRAAGLAALKGETTFQFSELGFESIALREEHLEADHQKAKEFLAPWDQLLNEAHADTDRLIRRTLKQEGRTQELQDPRFFLETVWADVENQSHQLALIWRRLNLPKAPPESLLELSESWRIIFEALGASIFLRSVRREAQRNPASFVDLIQLIYLSVVSDRRILVSDDEALRETANAVFHGRYPNIRIMSGADFINS